MRKLISLLAAFLLLLGSAVAQSQEEYLDVYIAKVKPDKRAAFYAVNKKLVEANRTKGDHWIAMETVYGDTTTVTFISTRQSYADVEKGNQAFEGAISSAYGKEGLQTLFTDFGGTVESTRGEIRRRRWELSTAAPADAAARTKMVGEARWLRTIMIRVRPGKSADFETLLRDIKAAGEKTASPSPTLVSQAVAGHLGTVYYVTVLRSSLAGFDGNPSMREMLGDQGYQNFLKVTGDVIMNTETVINRFVPELSNPPDEVAAAAPDFWRPKAGVPSTTASPTKPKANTKK